MQSETIESPLHRRLSAFVRWALRSEITALEYPFTWPIELRALSDFFTGYQWARAIGPGPARVIGVCRLPYRPPYELSKIESVIFKPDTDSKPPRQGNVDPLEHYLIVDLLSATTVHAYLSMLASPDKWYVLDQHRLTPEALRIRDQQASPIA